MSGFGLRWDESIPAQVGAALKTQSANLSVVAYADDQAYMRLATELPQFTSPTAVVILFSPDLFYRDFDDDRPHLIDFQISHDLHELGDTFLNRWLLQRLQSEDFYHLLKHKKNLRPDLMSEQELEDSQRRSWFIRIHRAIATPIRKVRRRTLKRLRDSGKLLPEGSK